VERSPGRDEGRSNRRPSIVAAVAALLWLAAACAQPELVFDRHGISFAYPEGWTGIAIEPIATTVGEPLSRDAVGMDGSNFVLVSRYRLAIPVTDANFEDHRDALTLEWGQAVEQGGASLTGPAETIEVDRLPGLRFEAVGIDRRGRPSVSTMVLVFDGHIEYFINCQRTEERAREIEAGCDRVLETFRVRQGRAAATSPASVAERSGSGRSYRSAAGVPGPRPAGRSRSAMR
jgi:hypothetical protein